MSAAALRRAEGEDIPFIMAVERRPGYDRMVGRWTEAEHFAALSNPGYAYLVGTGDAEHAAGFTILRDIDDPHGNVCLKRIAVAQPGRGFGGAFLSLVLAWTFAETPAHRIWLDVLADNKRARHVYTAAGFVEEGLLRQAYRLPQGGRIDPVLMSLLGPIGSHAVSPGGDALRRTPRSGEFALRTAERRAPLTTWMIT